MDGDVGKHELLERMERAGAGEIEIFPFEAKEAILAVLTGMEGFGV